MVNEVFTTNFDAGLAAFSKLKGRPTYFAATGEVFADEIVLSVSLHVQDELAATTVHSSTDFDPKASSPTAQDLLASCVDAIGTVFDRLMDTAEKGCIERLAQESLAVLEDVPFEWSQVEIERRKIWLKIDRSNPSVDQLTDEWIAKNDPDFQKHVEEEEAKTQDLFVTGPKSRDKKIH